MWVQIGPPGKELDSCRSCVLEDVWSCSVNFAGPSELDALGHTGLPVRRGQFRQIL